MIKPLIELKGICQAFDRRIVLDQINLKLYPGEAIGIIGPSGTGKSTLLKIMAGLIAPDAGEVYIQGQKRRGLIEDHNDSICIRMVFQQAALFDSLTVNENVGFILYEHSHLSPRKIQTLIDEKLEMVGLTGMGDRYPSELSGGMRTRVSLARSIMANPEDPHDQPDVLLYDEPTAGLDPIVATVIEDLIRNLHGRQGVCQSYVVVSHQQRTIQRTADRVLFLHQGQIRWEGYSRDLDTTPNPWIRQFQSGSLEGPVQLLSR